MIKTVTINLANQVFQIDENAFDVLKKYLDAVRNRFANSEGKEEIITDIESRIAEMLQEKISTSKQSIVLKDVEEIIDIMGKPEQFETTEEEEKETKNNSQDANEKKRLFRDNEDKVVAGVCSGLSAYFGINDPIWIRIAMVAFIFIGFGSAFWIYIILWIIVPKAKTSSDRLQMKGKSITIENIEKTISDDINDLKNQMQKGDTQSTVRMLISKIISIAAIIFRMAFKVLSKIIALLLIIIGIGWALFLAFGFIMPFGIFGVTFPEFLKVFFESNFQFFAGSLGIILLIGIPAFALIYTGIKLLLNYKTNKRFLGLSLLGLWIFGIVISIYVAVSLIRSFSNKQTISENILINSKNDTLYLAIENAESKNDEDFIFGSQSFEIDADNKIMLLYANELNVKKSENGEVYLAIKKSSRGSSKSSAYEKASDIQYSITQKDSLLIFPLKYTTDIINKYRTQELQATLFIPEGKTIFFSKGMENIIYDVKNVTDTYDGDMIGHHWKMLTNGLTCLDCNFSTNNSTSKSSISYDLSGYDAIQIDGNLNVEISQGETYSFSVLGNENFTKNFNAQIDSNLLTISSEFQWKNIFGKGNSGTVYITTPVLNTLEINGLNNTVIKNFNTKQLSLKINGASKNDINITTEKLNLDVGGASDINLRGNADVVEMNLAGASNLSAEDFEVNNLTIDIAGAGTAKIWAKEKLKVDLAGAATLNYKGNPKIVSNISGGSSLSKIE